MAAAAKDSIPSEEPMNKIALFGAAGAIGDRAAPARFLWAWGRQELPARRLPFHFCLTRPEVIILLAAHCWTAMAEEVSQE